MTKSNLQTGVALAVTWLTVFVLMELLALREPARAAYGEIGAWWAVMYVALLLRASWNDLPSFLVCMLIILTADTLFEIRQLYQEPISLASLQFMIVAIVRSAFWAVPVVANILIMKFFSRKEHR